MVQKKPETKLQKKPETKLPKTKPKKKVQYVVTKEIGGEKNGKTRKVRIYLLEMLTHFIEYILKHFYETNFCIFISKTQGGSEKSSQVLRHPRKAMEDEESQEKLQ